MFISARTKNFVYFSKRTFSCMLPFQNTPHQIIYFVLHFIKIGLSIGRARSILDPTGTRPAGVRWRGRRIQNQLPKKSIESVSGEVRVGLAESVARTKNSIKIYKKKLKKKKKKSIAKIWKILPETGKICRNLHFSLKMAWIFPNLAKSYQI